MSWPWKLRRAIEPRRAVSIRAMELETAKEILAEVFGARPGEVEEMIKRRLLGRANYDCDKAFQSLFLWNSPSESGFFSSFSLFLSVKPAFSPPPQSMSGIY